MYVYSSKKKKKMAITNQPQRHRSLSVWKSFHKYTHLKGQITYKWKPVLLKPYEIRVHQLQLLNIKNKSFLEACELHSISTFFDNPMTFKVLFYMIMTTKHLFLGEPFLEAQLKRQFSIQRATVLKLWLWIWQHLFSASLVQTYTCRCGYQFQRSLHNALSAWSIYQTLHTVKCARTFNLGLLCVCVYQVYVY